jgi:hypothetical protein
MAKKETTKPKNEREIDDSIPLKGFHEERADMGIDRGIKACRSDKSESSRKISKRRVPKEEGEIILENKPDFGFVQDRAPFRNITPAVEARLKKMVERLEAKKKKS